MLEDDSHGEDVMQSGWCFGCCERTGQKGDFPAECVYILPTITKPLPEVLVCEEGGREGEREGGEMSLTSFRLYLLDSLKEIWNV